MSDTTTNRILDCMGVFTGIMMLCWFSVEVGIIVSIVLDILLILYIIIAATILPTLKNTVPIYFGEAKKLNKSQVIFILILIAVTWLPYVCLYIANGHLF